ncbi:MAG: CpsB/CapC family capsule biosynthesis tyrosine phosphatase [Pseudomonadota bacterium]
MIDLHSHILSGIDDGARTIEDTVLLAQQSVDEGVTHMVCTPHVHPGVYDNTHDSISQAFDAAVEAIKSYNIPLKLSFAAEIRLSFEILEWIKGNNIPFLGRYKDKNVLLLELPHSHIPVGTDNLITWLSKQNIQAVIPHPERNREIMANYDKAIWLRNLGCLFQMTAGAVTGRFRDESSDTAWRMLEDNMFAYVASDLHNLHKRPNDMGKAYKQIEQAFGTNTAEKLFSETPAHITESTHWY